ncbi:MAG TPA: hypothetical protein VFH73_06995 [Polyangia bacterium]|nr:hypothetical protein [Polyangia bacterium]
MIRRLARRPGLVALVIALALMSGAVAHAADPPQVAVVRQPDADPVMVEVANRTQAELSASGFGAVMKDCARPAPDCLSLIAALPGPRSVGVATFRDGDQTTTEVRVNDRARPAVLRRASIPRDAGGADEAPVLAIRAVELVRATLLQADAAAAVVPSSVSPVVDATRASGPPPEVTATVGWSIGGGGALLESVHGFSAAYALLLRAGYRGENGLSGAMVVAGPGFTFDQATSSGVVRVRQELVALELGYSFRRSAPIQPRVAIGIGAHHIDVRLTDGASPGQASTFNLLASAGVGVLAILGTYVALFFDAQAIFTEPDRQYVIQNGAQLRFGSPSLLLSLGIQRTF